MDSTPRKSCNTLEMLYRPAPWNTGKHRDHTCFFMHKHLPGLGKLFEHEAVRTYKKRIKKSELFPASRPPPRPPYDKKSWIRAWIYIIVAVEKRYRSSKPSTCRCLRSLTKVRTFAIVYIYVHRNVRKLNLNFKVASLLP